LTETASISKNPNRRGFQSKSDFWGFLKFRTPGDPGKEGFLENRGFGPLFYINPSRRGPAVSRQEGSGKEGLGPLWGSPWSGCPGPGLREPGAGGTPPGNRGAPPRGVDVKPLAEAGVRSPDPGIRGSEDHPPGWPGVPPRDLGSRTLRDRRGLRDLGNRGPGNPGIRDPGSRNGLPRPRGRGPEGLFYINPSRRGPAVPTGSGSWRPPPALKSASGLCPPV